eukprot:1335737-Amorphochlora_amoeboformis.AAC.1
MESLSQAPWQRVACHFSFFLKFASFFNSFLEPSVSLGPCICISGGNRGGGRGSEEREGEGEPVRENLKAYPTARSSCKLPYLNGVAP